MKTINQLLLAAFTLLSFFSLGQFGELEINNYYDDCDYLVAEFYNADSLYYIHCDIDDYYGATDSILPGKYTLKIYCDDELKQTYHALIIQEGERSVIDLQEIYSYPVDEEDPIMDVFFAGLYTPNSLTGSPHIQQSFELKYTSIPYFGISEIFDIGMNFGFDYRYIQFSSDSSFSTIPDIKNERITNLNFVVGPNFRIGKHNDYTYTSVVMNFGTYYNIPLFNRYAFNISNKKFSEKHIHNYQDLSFYLRLGYRIISVHGEYRPFTIIKKGYPDQPKFKIGLAIQIPTY